MAASSRPTTPPATFTVSPAAWPSACNAGGVRFLQEADVRGLRPAGGRIEITLDLGPHGDTHGEQITADGVVICAGVGSRALAAQLGDRVNIYPVKGYSITVNLDDRPAGRRRPG